MRYVVLAFVLLSMEICTIPKKVFSRETSCESFLNEVKTLAREMEVLPLNIYAPESRMGIITSRPGVWRADLTFDRYRVFHRLKSLTEKIRKKEVDCSIAYLVKATPKEKGTLLMLLYLFEQTYRPEFRPRHQTCVNLFRPTSVRNDFSEKEWEKIPEAISRFVADQSVAFPKIKIIRNSDAVLDGIHRWEMRLGMMLQTEGSDDLPSALHSRRTDEMGERYLFPFAPLREKDPERYEKIDELFEYLSVQYIDSAGRGRIDCFNSSEKPKTVADIATQLLLARKWMLEYSAIQRNSLK